MSHRQAFALLWVVTLAAGSAVIAFAAGGLL